MTDPTAEQSAAPAVPTEANRKAFVACTANPAEREGYARAAVERLNLRTVRTGNDIVQAHRGAA